MSKTELAKGMRKQREKQKPDEIQIKKCVRHPHVNS